MKLAIAAVALAAVLAAPALAQPPAVSTEGSVKVEGVAPEKVLGAIDTTQLVDAATSAGAQPPAEASKPKTQVTVETAVQETATATIETKTEVIEPVSDRPALDPDNPIAPEVKAVVDGKARYSTDDLAQAQLAAVLATPTSIPTTVITTTTTTPKADQ